MNDPSEKEHAVFSKKECQDWKRTREKGVVRFLVFFANITGITLGMMITLVLFFTDSSIASRWYFLLLFFLTTWLCTGLSFGLIFGFVFWTIMERQYQASMKYQPTEEDVTERDISIGRMKLIFIPLGCVALITFFAPESISAPACFVASGFLGPLFAYACIKDGTWTDDKGTVPINHPRAIFYLTFLILSGIAMSLFGAYGVYSNWGLEGVPVN